MWVQVTEGVRIPQKQGLGHRGAESEKDIPGPPQGRAETVWHLLGDWPILAC